MSNGSISQESAKQPELFPMEQTGLAEAENNADQNQKKPRKKREVKPKPPPEPKPDDRLLSAIQFVSIAQPKRSNNPAEIHCRMWAKQLSTFGGVLSAGIGIQEEIECCPHTQKMLDALQECPDTINLTLLPTRELSIKSGNFLATIPCIEQTDLPPIYGDQSVLPVSFEFQRALEQAGTIVNERNRTVLYSSVQMMDESVFATNGEVILESWHGCPAPSNLIVPKLFIKALHRAKGKTLYSLGCTGNSLTGYFPDGSWLKTQLHNDDSFPKLKEFFTMQVDLQLVPLGFFAAVERLAPFSNDDRIYLRKEGMCTDRYQTDGAINTCEGLPDGISFSISSLRLIQPFAEKIAFNVTQGMTYFQSRTCRGVIAQRTI